MASIVPPGSGIPGSDQLAFLKTSKLAAYLGGILVLIAGIVVLAWPKGTIKVVAVIVGVALVIAGLAQIVDALGTRQAGSYWGLLLFRGALELIVGLVAVFWPGITIWALVLLFGIELLFSGFLSIFLSFQIPAEHATKSFHLWRGILSILAGLVVLIWPGATVWVLVVVVGIYFVFAGLLLLYIGFQLGRAEKTVSAA